MTEAPDRLAQLQGAAEAAKKLLTEQNRLAATIKPKLTRIEYLDRELQRRHETIRILVQERVLTKGDLSEVTDAIVDLTEALVQAVNDLVIEPTKTGES